MLRSIALLSAVHRHESIDVQHLFMCFLVAYISSSEKDKFRYFAHFSVCVCLAASGNFWNLNSPTTRDQIDTIKNESSASEPVGCQGIPMLVFLVVCFLFFCF